jgi:hypothetical protein
VKIKETNQVYHLSWKSQIIEQYITEELAIYLKFKVKDKLYFNSFIVERNLEISPFWYYGCYLQANFIIKWNI